MAFGKEIKRIKENQKLTAARVAEILGVSADRLRKWMQKDLNPKEDDVIIMERKLGMSIEEIMNLEKLPLIQKVPNSDETIYVNDKDLFEFAGNRVELIAAMRAAIKILTLRNIEMDVKLSELESKVAGGKIPTRSFADVSLKLEKMMQDASERILDEWRKK